MFIAVLVILQRLWWRISGVYSVRMKKPNKIVHQYLPFRVLIKQWFQSLIKRNNSGCSNEYNQVMKKLQEIEDAIEVISRQIAKWAKADSEE
ncbi:MAG: hypothetical protein WCO56_02215 [Verrucomicrobiota bacterium]